MKKPKTYSSKLVFILSFIFIYLTLGLFFWIYANIESFSYKKQLMRTYIQKNKETLKEEVFSSIYSQAKQCNSLLENKEKENCQKATSKSLAIAIKEEQLSANDYDWPNDLYFVKQEGERYYLLGWSGRVEDISHKVKISPLSKKIHTLAFLTRTCKYFNVYDFDSYCEIYEPIFLEENKMGYMIRLIPFEEETHPLIIAFPFVAIPMPFLLFLLFPVMGAGLFTYILRNKLE